MVRLAFYPIGFDFNRKHTAAVGFLISKENFGAPEYFCCTWHISLKEAAIRKGRKDFFKAELLKATRMCASYVATKSLRITGYTLSSFLHGRQVHGNAELLNNCTKVENKNPRSMELLRIARKPAGYHLEKPGRNYWHKLQLLKTGRHITAEVIHFQNGPVVTASTIEWSIKKQLYRLKDAAAYQNIGKILARRCLESGIHFMRCDIRSSDGDKIKLFLHEIKSNGIILQEHKCYHNPQPWSLDRPEKPWAVVE